MTTISFIFRSGDLGGLFERKNKIEVLEYPNGIRIERIARDFIIIRLQVRQRLLVIEIYPECVITLSHKFVRA